MTHSTLLLICGVVACISTMVATPVVRGFAVRTGVLDQPLGYKAHERPTPLLGGIGIIAGLLAGVLCAFLLTVGFSTEKLLVLLSGLLVVTTAGVIDDTRGLSPQMKLLWQVSAAICAGLVLLALGFRISMYLQRLGTLPLAFITLVWIVVVTNALNLLDNMNGLCAGLGAVAASSLAVINLQSGELSVAFMAAALAGACVGFLPYNWPSARLFLGDAGSMAIGFALASLAVIGDYAPGSEIPVLAILARLLVLAIPLVDLVVVVIIRLRDRHPPWRGDRRHISHRLVRRGMRPAVAVATLWLAGAVCGIGGLLLHSVDSGEALLLLTLVVGALAAVFTVAGLRGLG